MKKLFNLENFIYFTLVALPAYLLKFRIFGLSTNLLEFSIGLVFVFWLIKIKFRFSDLKMPENKIIFSTLLILVGLVVSAWANPYPAVGLGIIKSWFIFPLLLVFVIYNYIPRDKLKNVYHAVYFSSFSVALVSLGYFLLGRLTYDGRLEVFFNSPNYLAMYLAPGLIIFLAQIQNSKFKVQNYNSKFKFFAASSFAVISLAFYFTYSYAAWLSAASSVLAIFLVQKNISLKKIAMVAAIIFLLIFSQLNNNKFVGLIASNPRSSAASRVMIWRAAGKMLADHWLIGIGPGNFQMNYLADQKYFPLYLEWAVPHPQNVYLAFWLYGGLLGFVGFLALLFFYFKNIFQKIKKAPQDASIFIISFGIMLYILLHGLVDTTIFKNDLAVVFWLNFLMAA